MISNVEFSVEKCLTDYKSYRIVSLENGLKAVLISDIKPVSNNDINDNDDDEDGIQKSAAALCIDIGSFSDPFELQGLAHYLEHMVFMGSDKYPTENDFDACVSQHGGQSNAWTDAEKTLFYFDCHQDHFVEVLDKFANFFISPLMLKDSMDRELTAVNSEFEMTYSNDSCRTEHLLQTTAKLDNPYRIFGCGNTKSLKDDPMAKDIDIYRYLQEFRKNQYSSHNMTLAVQSRDTLDNIEKYVRKIFSEVPNNGFKKISMEKFSQPFDTTNFSRLYQVVPIKDVKSVQLNWSLPSVLKHYSSKPLQFLGHIIGHEGKGCLANYLREKDFIVNLEAGNANGGFESSSFNSMFTVNLRLTDLGYARITEVIEIVFSYIELMKNGFSHGSLEDYQKICRNNFFYREQEEPVDNVENLAKNLQLYRVEHIISGPSLISQLNPELCQELVNMMTTSRVNIMIHSRLFEGHTALETDAYHVKYSVRDFTSEERSTWENPRFTNDLVLPRNNSYLPTNFELLDVDGCSENPVNLATTQYPELSIYGDLWHMLDSNFRVPKGTVNFCLKHESLCDSAEKATMLDLILYSINQDLLSEAYDASIAGLNYKIESVESGVFIEIEGFSDKISRLFRTIIDRLANFSVDDNKLSIYKETMRQMYQNSAIKSDKLIWYIKNKIMVPSYWTNIELMHSLKNISIHNIQSHGKTLLSHAAITSYFHGNISPDVAQGCFNYVVEKLKITAAGKLKKTQLRALPTGTKHVRVMSLNPSDVNTAIVALYQIGHGSLELQALNEFLSFLLSEPCFDYLRTKETLGYSVGIFDEKQKGVLSLNVYVMSQANKFSVDSCSQKISLFLETMSTNIINELSDEDFEEFKSSFISNKLVEDTRMSDAESRNWSEIMRQDFVFNRRFKLVDIIEKATKEDILYFFQKHYLDRTIQRKLIVEVDSRDKDFNGNSPKQMSVEEELHLEYVLCPGYERVTTIESIQASCDLCPVFKY